MTNRNEHSEQTSEALACLSRLSCDLRHLTVSWKTLRVTLRKGTQVWVAMVTPADLFLNGWSWSLELFWWSHSGQSQSQSMSLLEWKCFPCNLTSLVTTRHADTLSTLFALWSERKQRICVTQLYVQWYSPKWREGDVEGTNCWIKSLFLFSFAHKKYSRSFVKLRLNPWCHMDYFTDLLAMFLDLDRVRTLAVYGGSENSWILSKIS